MSMGGMFAKLAMVKDQKYDVQCPRCSLYYNSMRDEPCLEIVPIARVQSKTMSPIQRAVINQKQESSYAKRSVSRPHRRW